MRWSGLVLKTIRIRVEAAYGRAKRKIQSFAAHRKSRLALSESIEKIGARRLRLERAISRIGASIGLGVKEQGWLWVAWPICVSVAGFFWSWWNWDDLSAGNTHVSVIMSNLAIVFGAAIALPLGIWRAKVAARQAQTAEAGRLDERFLRGAEMLSSELLSVRAGGIFVLEQLAMEYPRQFHVQVLKVLCAFIRNPKNLESDESDRLASSVPPHDPVGTIREDIQLALDAIGERIGRRRHVEDDEGFRFDFRGADLRGARLTGMDFSQYEGGRESYRTFAAWLSPNKADFSGALLCSADMHFANFRGANLEDACLCGARLPFALQDSTLAGANLHRLTWFHVDISGVIFAISGKRAQGIRQSDIDDCTISSSGPPNLDGVLDYFSGEPLIWRGV